MTWIALIAVAMVITAVVIYHWPEAECLNTNCIPTRITNKLHLATREIPTNA